MKKKYAIILVTIIMIVIVLILIVVNINEKSNVNDNLIQERINEIIDNSYKYYLLKEGHITLGNDIIVKDGITYRIIEEEWLTKIDDIVNIIEDTFIKSREYNFYNGIFDKHKIIEQDGNLYINLSEENCEVDFEINKSNITFEKKDNDTILIDFDVYRIYSYYEDGKWKLSNNIYVCS